LAAARVWFLILLAVGFGLILHGSGGGTWLAGGVPTDPDRLAGLWSFVIAGKRVSVWRLAPVLCVLAFPVILKTLRERHYIDGPGATRDLGVALSGLMALVVWLEQLAPSGAGGRTALGIDLFMAALPAVTGWFLQSMLARFRWTESDRELMAADQLVRYAGALGEQAAELVERTVVLRRTVEDQLRRAADSAETAMTTSLQREQELMGGAVREAVGLLVSAVTAVREEVAAANQPLLDVQQRVQASLGDVAVQIGVMNRPLADAVEMMVRYAEAWSSLNQDARAASALLAEQQAVMISVRRPLDALKKSAEGGLADSLAELDKLHKGFAALQALQERHIEESGQRLARMARDMENSITQLQRLQAQAAATAGEAESTLLRVGMTLTEAVDYVSNELGGASSPLPATSGGGRPARPTGT